MIIAMSNQTLGSRIKSARTGAGLTQAELGRIFSISREAVSQWESDDNQPTPDKIERIAKETHVSAGWLLTGQGERAGSAPPMPTLPAGAASTQFMMGDIPIMGTAEGGPDGLVEWNGEVVAYIDRPPFLKGVVGGYALYVRGTSMQPRYNDGELVYVHPNLPITGASFVVVQFDPDGNGGTPCAWIKQFVRRQNTETTFRQFNPEKVLKIPTSRIVAVHRIVGSRENIS